MTTIARTKNLLAHVQIARNLLVAIETSCHLRIEASSSLTAEERARLLAFWEQQLSYVAAEIDSAQETLIYETRT